MSTSPDAGPFGNKDVTPWITRPELPLVVTLQSAEATYCHNRLHRIRCAGTCFLFHRSSGTGRVVAARGDRDRNETNERDAGSKKQKGTHEGWRALARRFRGLHPALSPSIYFD